VPVFEHLDGLLPTARLVPMRESVEDFDFRRAEQMVRDLVAELNEQRE